MDRRIHPAAALAPLAVLAVDPAGLAPFGPAKWAVIPSAVLVAFAATGAGRGLERRTAALWALFLALVVLAAVLGLDDLYAWTGTPERHFGAITWVLCALAFVTGQRLDDDGRRAALVGCAIAAGAVGLWSAAETFGWHPIDLVGAGDRPVGTLGSSAYLGAAAALVTPAAMGLGRRWGTVAAALGGVALVVSGARAAWLGAIVAGVLVIVVRRPPRWQVWTVAIMAAAVAIALIAGVASRAPHAVTDRNGGIRGRIDEWRVASRVIADHPVLGVGPEGYRIAFGDAVDRRYERVHGRNPLPDRAHDSVLDVAATTGVAGALVYVALFAAVGTFVVDALRRGSLAVAAAATGVAAYATQSLFVFPLAELDPVMWLLAGIVVGAGARRCVRDRAAPAVRITVTLLAVLALIAGGIDVVADHRAKHALLAYSPTTNEATAAARLRPDQIRYHLAAASVLERVGSSAAIDRALEQLDDARRISPRDPVVGEERAGVLLVRAQRAGSARLARRAERAYEELLRHDPYNSDLRRGLERARRLVADGT